MKRRNRQPTTEAEMVATLVASVGRVFGPHADHATEVGTHGRARTDVCVFVENTLIAIEAKLSNRRRAIGQAFFNRYYADQSYIAVLENHLTVNLAAEAQHWQLRILAISQDST